MSQFQALEFLNLIGAVSNMRFPTLEPSIDFSNSVYYFLFIISRKIESNTRQPNIFKQVDRSVVHGMIHRTQDIHHHQDHLACIYLHPNILN